MTCPPFPSVFDSSILAAIRSCQRRAYLEYVEHFKSSEPSVHLVAGGAYAHGLEVARKAFHVQHLPSEECVALGLQALFASYGDFQCPPESAKSLENTLGALEFYFSRYPLETDPFVPLTLPGGQIGVEFSFAEPLEILHPETGDPLIYCGRLDQLGKLDGLTLGFDDKTTSQLGATWPRQWDLRSQFTAYCWGAGRAGVKLDGFLVRGIAIKKTGYDTLEAITYRPEWQIERWYEQTLRDIQRFMRAWEEGYYDYAIDNACLEYGGCQFKQICLMREPAAMLESRFQRRIWDPLKREERVIA